MKLCTIRHRLAKLGYILLKTSEGFTITDNGVKTPFEEHFPDLTTVERWLTKHHTNRLTEKECDAWDKDWTKFVSRYKL